MNFIFIIFFLFYGAFYSTESLRIYNYSTQHCLSSADSPHWERRYDVNNKPEPIVIEVTQRASHRIISHILAILLRERLNYTFIQFATADWDDASNAVSRLSCRAHEGGGAVGGGNQCNYSTINLEVWMPAGFNVEKWVNMGHVIDCGPLGPTARLGLFAHTRFVNDSVYRHQVSVDHWRTLKDPSSRRLFQWPTWLRPSKDNDEQQLANTTTNASKEGRLDDCLHRHLTAGCPFPLRNDCLPVILDSEQKDLIWEMEYLSLKLYDTSVFTYFIGNASCIRSVAWHLDHLPTSAVNESHVYLLNWFPNSITVNESYSRLTLPDCYDKDDDADLDVNNKGPQQNHTCRFQINQVTKVVASILKNHAKPAYSLVEHMRFTQKDYENMLRKVVLTSTGEDLTEQDLQRIACEWVQENREKWTFWTADYNNKTILNIAGMFAFHGKWISHDLDIAAKHAVEYMNNDVLKDSQYSFHLVVRNVSCEEEVVLQDYLQLTTSSCHNTSQPIGIIAALCSDAIGPMLKLTNKSRLLVVSPTVESAKHNFKFFFRTVPSMEPYSHLLVRLFKHFKWQRIVLLRKDDHFIHPKFFKNFDIDVVDEVVDERRLTHASLLNITNTLTKIKERRRRIFVVEYFAQGTCKILCAAKRLEMTLENGHVWFVNPWLDDIWWKDCAAANTNTQNQENFQCDQREIDEMVRGVFTLKHEQPDIGKTQSSNFRNTFYSSYTYVATRVIGQAVAKLLKENPAALSAYLSQNVSSQLLSIVKRMPLAEVSVSTTASGKLESSLLQKASSSSSSLKDSTNSNAKVNVIAKNASDATAADSQLTFDLFNTRPTTKWILQQLQVNVSSSAVDESRSSLSFRTVIQWIFPSDHNITSSSLIDDSNLPKLTEVHTIYWTNDPSKQNQHPDDGHIPDTSDECGIVEPLRSALNISCQFTIVLINIIVIVILIFIGLIFLLYFRYKITQNVDQSEKKIFEALCQELSDLVIHSPHCVINRKLGRGAFGMVYGGEVKRNERWTLAAVKRLNTEEFTTYEEKTNFLTEAKIMRDLNHPNIVQLYGISLDILSLVLEYMLYGDLKNYLLVRRAVAMDSNNQEVRPSTLTKFALDIAHGLSFLHENKIIHRDIACRNCLINSDYVVKLGDFGLARPMSEGTTSGCYRLCKAREVPIRWMPPEAIIRGLFTAKSDIWSYGIVLFEIITFGVFPFRNYKDFELLDVMNQYDFAIGIILPPASEGYPIWNLIHYCCEKQSEHRPLNMGVVIEYIRSHPDCVQPFLTEEPPELEKTSEFVFTGTGEMAKANVMVKGPKHAPPYRKFLPQFMSRGGGGGGGGRRHSALDNHNASLFCLSPMPLAGGGGPPPPSQSATASPPGEMDKLIMKNANDSNLAQQSTWTCSTEYLNNNVDAREVRVDARSNEEQTKPMESDHSSSLASASTSPVKQTTTTDCEVGLIYQRRGTTTTTTDGNNSSNSNNFEPVRNNSNNSDDPMNSRRTYANWPDCGLGVYDHDQYVRL